MNFTRIDSKIDFSHTTRGFYSNSNPSSVHSLDGSVSTKSDSGSGEGSVGCNERNLTAVSEAELDAVIDGIKQISSSVSTPIGVNIVTPTVILRSTNTSRLENMDCEEELPSFFQAPVNICSSSDYSSKKETKKRSNDQDRIIEGAKRARHATAMTVSPVNQDVDVSVSLTASKIENIYKKRKVDRSY